MSTFVHYDLTCHACGVDFTVPVLEGMHITRIPEYRQAILDRTFQVFPCPACAHSHRVETSSVYTDFDRWQYVAVGEPVVTDLRAAVTLAREVFDESFAFGPSLAQEFAVGMAKRCRYVVGVEALREKLLIWDADLDDRVVEALKAETMADMGVDSARELWRVSTVLDGGHVLFARLTPTDLTSGAVGARRFAPLGHVTVTQSAYENCRDVIDSAFSVGKHPWIHEDWLIDLYFGRPAIEDLAAELETGEYVTAATTL